MNKDYAIYRLNHLVRHFAGFSFHDEKVLTHHYEEDSSGAFLKTTCFEFALYYVLPSAPGMGFSASSAPFELWDLTKTKLDNIFRETFVKLTQTYHDHVILNIQEGKQ